MRRLLPVLAVLAAAALPASASAVRWLPCGSGTSCTTVVVPLDRSGRVPGVVHLHVRRRLPPGGAPSGTLVFVAGGPGQAATPFVPDPALERVPGLAGYRQLAIDPRGTGRSDPLRCAALAAPARSADEQQAQAERCALEIGPRRRFYTTRDNAEDIASVVHALRLGRVTVEGVSYGTEVAAALARLHPALVRAVILRSPLPPAGRDPFQRSTLHALPHVLDDVCGTTCGAAIPHPGDDLVTLADRLARDPVSLPTGVRGEPVAVLTGQELLALVVESDLGFGIAQALPAAVHAGVRGDLRALARLDGLAHLRLPSSGYVNPVLLTTVCEDGPLPWPRGLDPAARAATLAARISTLPAGSTGRFGRWALDPAQQWYPGICLRWPDDPRPAPLPPLGRVPLLALAGGRDARTPPADALAYARAVPGRAAVVTPGAGHGTLGPCALEAIGDLVGSLGRRAARRCPAQPVHPELPPRAPAPADPVEEARLVAKDVAVAVRIVDDEQAPGAVALAGAAGGTATIRPGAWARSVELARYALVPGVALTGTLVVSPQADGTAAARFEGTVDGKAGPARVARAWDSLDR